MTSPRRGALPWSRAGRKSRRESRAPRFRRRCGRPWRRQCHRRSPPRRRGAASAAPSRTRRRRNLRCARAARFREANPTLALTPETRSAIADPGPDPRAVRPVSPDDDAGEFNCAPVGLQVIEQAAIVSTYCRRWRRRASPSDRRTSDQAYSASRRWHRARRSWRR